MNLVNKVERGIVKIKKERDEWIKKYQGVVDIYKSSIDENTKNINILIKQIEDINKKDTELYNEINEIEKFLKEYSKQTNKNIENIEKRSSEIESISNHNIKKLERHGAYISDIKSNLSNINERLKLLEERMEKHDKIFNEIKSDIKEFKNYIIDFMNGMTKEYEKRFEKFKARYDEVMSTSNNLKTEIKKTNSMYSDFEKSMRRISSIENKLDKLEANLNMIDRRMNVFKREKQIIVDKFYSLKDNQTKQLKELEDTLVLLSADINKLKIKQAKLESD